MPSAEPDEPEPAPPRRPGRRRPAAAATALVLAVIAVAFVAGARSEVERARTPGQIEPVDPEVQALMAASSSGTECGGWPQEIGPSADPRVAPLATVLWGDATSFHVQTAHLFVTTVRIEVDGGTAQTATLPAASTLDVPVEAGRRADLTITCDASSVTVRLLDPQGRDVSDAELALGAGRPAPAPLEIHKHAAAEASDGAAAPEACAVVADATRSLGGGADDEDRAAAIEQLVEQAEASTESLQDHLSKQEIADVGTVIELGRTRAEMLRTGDAAALDPIDADQSEAVDRVRQALERECP
jgi:hypothetical protein